MDQDIANIVTQRIQSQMGAMLLQLIQLQAEKEAAEAALAASRDPANRQEPAEGK